jgi:chaperonin GroEL
MIATAVDSIGKDGTITVEEGRSVDTVLDVIEGFRFDSGYAAQAFITDERKSAVRHKNVLILVTDHNLESVEQLLPTLEIVARSGRPLIVVADNIEGQALAALIMNSLRGTMKVVGVKAPRYGEERRNILSDLAVSVGATFITRESDVTLENIKLEHLGTAASVEVLKKSTTVIGGACRRFA